MEAKGNKVKGERLKVETEVGSRNAEWGKRQKVRR
jgi:hypothetical protein